MTIKVYKDRIELGSYTLTATPTGASLNGSIAASKIATRFVVGQGQSFGYNMSTSGIAPVNWNITGGYKFSFVNDGITQKLVSDISPQNSLMRYRGTAHSSQTHGYNAKTYGVNASFENQLITATYYTGDDADRNLKTTPQWGYRNIERFPFSSGFAFEDVGTLTNFFRSERTMVTSAGLSSKYDGYVIGPSSATSTDHILKFSFSSGVNKSHVSTGGSYWIEGYPASAECGLSTEYYGYHWYYSTVKRFPFANENLMVVMPATLNSINTGIGPLVTPNPVTVTASIGRGYMAGITGPDNGYFCFGGISETNIVGGPLAPTPSYITLYGPYNMGTLPSFYSRITKYQFSSDVLSAISYPGVFAAAMGGTASPTKGYLLSGRGPLFASPDIPSTISLMPYRFISGEGSSAGGFSATGVPNGNRISFDFSTEVLSALPQAPATNNFGLAFQY